MDTIYLPFMQSNVLNYSQKLFDYFERDITEKINSSFMTLVVNNEEINDEKILSKYGNNIFERYIKVKNETLQIINDNSNEKLAIKIDLNVKIVKDKKDAKTTFRIAQEGEEPVRIIKELKDTISSILFKNSGLKTSFKLSNILSLLIDCFAKPIEFVFKLES